MVIKELVSSNTNSSITYNVGVSGKYRIILKNPTKDMTLNVYDNNDDLIFTKNISSGVTYDITDIYISNNCKFSFGALLSSVKYTIYYIKEC